VHADEAAEEKVPAEHVKQVVSLPRPNVPAEQPVHAEFRQYVPAPQQTVAPVLVHWANVVGGLQPEVLHAITLLPDW
jgi:hypothetical protein